MPLPEILTRREYNPNWLSRAQRSGLITPVLPGISLRADVSSKPTMLARAAMLWRPDAVIGGEYAAHLTFWRDIPITAIDVFTRTTIKRRGFRFHERTIPPSLSGRHGYFTITGTALTALDLALTHGPDVIDRALRSRLVRIADLRAALAGTPGRDGNRQRRELLLDSRAEPWSAAERLAHSVLREAGIAGWTANAPVRLHGQPYWLDVAFPPMKLVLEIDGREEHSKPEVFENDRDRQNELVLDGWTVLRTTWRKLTDRPGEVVDTVRRGIRYATRLTQSRGQIAEWARISRSAAI